MNRFLSMYLDLVRFMAALIVFIVHANYQRFTNGLPYLGKLGGLGNDAVMVFFVLSGFVIAYVVQNKEKSLDVYLSSRLARLWSVGIPAIVLTIILDLAGSKIYPQLYDGWWYQSDRPLIRIAMNMFF